jgi:hypothetical protein
VPVRAPRFRRRYVRGYECDDGRFRYIASVAVLAFESRAGVRSRIHRLFGLDMLRPARLATG